MNGVRIFPWVVPLALAITGCSSNPQGPSQRFIIQVDSVQVPDVVGFQSPLELNFFGRIGSNLCYEFDRFEAEQSQGLLELTLWGKWSGGSICPTARAELRGRSFIKSPPHDNPMRVRVHQPEGPPLELVVEVSE